MSLTCIFKLRPNQKNSCWLVQVRLSWIVKFSISINLIFSIFSLIPGFMINQSCYYLSSFLKKPALNNAKQARKERTRGGIFLRVNKNRLLKECCLRVYPGIHPFQQSHADVSPTAQQASLVLVALNVDDQLCENKLCCGISDLLSQINTQ